MGIRVYITANSGNQKIENEQQKILMVLKTRKKEFEVIDIMAPGNQNHRTFMRENGKKKEGQRNAIPPQIFNGDQFKGDFEDFDIANEDDLLEEFLGIERESPKVEPYKTGAMAPEVKQRVVGKLTKDRIPVIKTEEKKGPKTPPHKAGAHCSSSCSHPKDPTSNSNDSSKDSSNTKDSSNDSTSATSSCYGETDSGVDLEDKNSDREFVDSDDEDVSEESEEEELGQDSSNNKKGVCKKGGDSEENFKQQQKLVIDDDSEKSEAEDSETDSEDFTDSEDDTVEYMPDGEVMRKGKKGFKMLNNCKRFWKVGNNV